MKKLLTLLFCVQLTVSALAAAWTGTIATGFSGGDGLLATPYLIGTADELAYLAQQTNLASSFSTGKYYKLTADIDLGNVAWTPIGTSTQKFGGNFDGDNYVISKINCVLASAYVGLFGYIAPISGTPKTPMYIIKNLTIASGTIQGTNYVGGFVGRGDYVSFINCKNAASVTGTTVTGSATYVGGIVGRAGSISNFEYCSNTGTINGGPGEYVGGIVGNASFGIVGSSLATYQYIRYCYNNGAVSSTTRYVGGITGGASGAYLPIIQCFNSGKISAKNNCVGGIIGYAANSGTDAGQVTIDNCYNTGEVTAATGGTGNTSGGIVGFTSSPTKWFKSITSCYNTGSLTSTTATTKEAIAGQLLASPPTGFGVVSNCYYLTGSATTNTNGGTVKTDAELKAGAFLTSINVSSVWGQNGSYNSGYPYLLKQTLSTPTANAATTVTSGGFTASWTNVNLTNSYDIKVYNGASVVSTTTATSVSSIAITGLSPNTAYTYTVTAKGDGTNTFNSAESTPQSFTTLSLPALSTPTANAATSTLPYGFTANWDVVGSAVSYNIKVYDATPTLISTTNASSGTSKAITGLIPNTAYTYTVTAVADNVVNANSAASLPQSFSTSATTPWDGNLAASYAGGIGTLADPYQIATAEQLAYLASLVNAAGQTSNGNTSGKYYKLTADVDLKGSAHTWTPMGTSGTIAFAGVFDGNYHSINNIIVNRTSSDFNGLFGYVQGVSSASKAVIKNLIIASGSITGQSYNGAIAGRANFVQITNCKNLINVSGSVASGGPEAGGIVGRLGSVSIVENCSNSGTISSEGAGLHSGGIVGNAAVSSTVGDLSLIQYCYNTGSITGVSNAGGITGSGNGNLTIKECYNKGTISASNVDGGGIVGYGFGTGFNVLNCYNRGMVIQPSPTVAVYYLGGIFGYPGGNAAGKYFQAVTNCYNTASVTALTAGGVTEAIAGSLTGGASAGGSGSIVNSYYLNTLTVTNTNGGTSKTDAELKAAGFITSLENGQNPTAWSSDASSKNNGYPILTWQTTSSSSLSAPTVGTASAITTTGFTANWSTAANAIGYTVNVYLNGTTFYSTASVTGQSTTSLAINGLTSNSDFTYKVAAISNLGTVDSNESSASETFATTTTSSTDYFRTKSTGNWSSSSIWESSTNNTNWGNATAAPNSSATSVSILNGHTVSVTANVTTSSLTINTGATVTVNAGIQLTVSTTLSNSGALNLLSNNSNGNATILTPNTLGGTDGVYTVQQYLGSARNWYLSSPVSGATVQAGQSYFSYDEAGSNFGFVAPASLYWKAEAEGAALDSRKGYILQTAEVSTLSFTGTLNNGSQTPLSLNRTAGKSNEGFNLVANPYPSYLDWSLVSAANTGLLTTAWFRTKNNSGGYIFATVNVASPSSPVIVAVDPNTTITKLIPPMQAYWVRVSTVGSTNYTVNNEMRAHADNSANKFKAPAQSTQPLLRLRVSNGTNADETVVLFNANATNGMDMFDSPKMSNNSASVPEIYTQVDTEKLVINGMKNITYNTEIPLGFSTGTASNFSISANEISNFESGTKVILIDKLNPNTEFELNEGANYSFRAEITSPTTNRFSLLFRAPGVATGVDVSEIQNAQVFVNSANQITIIEAEKRNYAIYNAMGQVIETGITTSNYQTSNFQLTTGVYVVKVGNKSIRVVAP